MKKAKAPKKTLEGKSKASKMKKATLPIGKGVPMPQPSPRFIMIARKMMCGLTVGKNQYTPEQFQAFQDRFKSGIVWVDEHMPRQLAGRAISMGVLGAIGKGVLWYGVDKMEPFCLALGKGQFQGIGDPAHILWLWLTGRSKYNCDVAYRKTVAAIRSFVLGKQLMRMRNGRKEIGHFAPAETDLFEWDSTFTTMLKRHSNSGKKDFKTYGPDGPSDEEIRLSEEVEEAMASIR